MTLNPALDERERLMQALFRMLHVQQRRGPDDMGVYSRHGVHMGHRLLRILPCPHAAQPLTSINAAISIVFNGQVYNFKELRADLQARGIAFRTDTDTEVILELYRADGPTAFQRLRGMFAFVIHDQSKGLVIAARDPFGQKPLYLRRTQGRVVFASTMKAIIEADKQGLQVDQEALYHTLWMLMPPGERTLLQNVELLEPGTFLIVRESDLYEQRGRFAAVTFTEERSELTLAAASDEFMSLLERAVREQLVERETSAAHLSGGLDSSAIVALAARIDAGRLATFSCSYQSIQNEVWDDERGFEEAHYARLVAEHSGVANDVVHVAPDDYFFDLVDLVDTIDEPRGNPCLPHMQLARAIGGAHRVVLSGEGADEILGGYHWKLRHAFDGSATGYWHSLLPAPASVLHAALQGPYSDPQHSLAYVQARTHAPLGTARLKQLMQFDFEHFMRYLLLQADKLAGRFSLEGRYPFLDAKVVEFATKLPARLIFDLDGNSKPLLRQGVAAYLPGSVLARPKIGFVAPEGGWYRGVLAGLVTGILCAPGAFVHELYKPEALERLLDEHRRGVRNSRKLIWSLLTLEIWHKLVIEGCSKEALQDRVHAMRFDGRARRQAHQPMTME